MSTITGNSSLTSTGTATSTASSSKTTNAFSSIASNTTGSTKDSATTMAQTFDNFLKILTTQLKNQDPLSPMDSNEFTQQLVQFSMVEQQINGNAKLDQMIESSKLNATLNAVGFIDKTVEVKGNQMTLTKGGTTTFGVDLDKKAENATATITDSTGKVVRTIKLKTDAGYQSVTWDGKTNDKVAAPAGLYKVTVNASNSAGDNVESTLYTTGKVTDVQVDDSTGATMLTLDGQATAALSGVRAIKKA